MALAEENIILRFTTDTTNLDRGATRVERRLTGLRGIAASATNVFKGLFAFNVAATVFNQLREATVLVRDFEAALSQVRSITGLSQEAIEDLGGAALNTSQQVGISATEILRGYQLVGSASPQLLENAEALDAVTRQVGILARASGIEFAQAASILPGLLNQFGASSFEAAGFVDILATSQQRGTATIARLAESFKNVGSVAAAANVSFEDTNVLLQALARGGLDGAEAGTALRNIITRLAATNREELNPSTQSFNDILEILSNEVTDISSAVNLFGRENAAAALTLIQQRDVVDNLTGSLNEFGNAQDQANINSDNLTGRINRLSVAWENLILSVDQGNSVFSNFTKSVVSDTGSILDALRLVNDGVITSFAEFGTVTTGSLEQRQAAIARLLEAQRILENNGVAAGGRGGRGDNERQITQRQQLIAQLNEDLVGLDEASEQYQRTITSINATQAELNRLIGDNEIDQTTEKTKTLGDTIAELTARQKALREELSKATIGSSEFTRIQNELTNVTTRLNRVTGRNQRQTNEAQREIDVFITEQERIDEAAMIAIEDSARAIEDLRISLIQDSTDRRIAERQLQTQREIDAIVVTGEQRATQVLLLEQRLVNEIQTIRRESFEVERTQAQQLIDETDDAEEQAIVERQEREVAAIIRASNEKILAITQSQLAEARARQATGQTLTPEQQQQLDFATGQEQAQIELEALQAQLQNLNLSGQERIALKQQIADAELAIVNAQIEEETRLREKQREQLREAATFVLTQAKEIATNVIQTQIERTDREINIQEGRVQKALQLAEFGNTELLQLEEERLRELNAQKEQDLQRQRRLASIEIAINSAVSISRAIAAAVRSFAEGGVIGGLLNIGAAIAAVAALVSAVSNATSSVPSFAVGTESLDGKGAAPGPSKGFIIEAHKGERILTEKQNKEIKQLGNIANEEIPGLVRAGLESKKTNTVNEESKVKKTYIQKLKDVIKEKLTLTNSNSQEEELSVNKKIKRLEKELNFERSNVKNTSSEESNIRKSYVDQLKEVRKQTSIFNISNRKEEELNAKKTYIKRLENELDFKKTKVKSIVKEELKLNTLIIPEVKTNVIPTISKTVISANQNSATGSNESFRNDLVDVIRKEGKASREQQERMIKRLDKLEIKTSVTNGEIATIVKKYNDRQKRINNK